MKVICQYCNKPARYTDSKAVYGKSYGMIYLCDHCGAYVGVHKGTDIPFGILANAELRGWKKKAHESFDPLWKSGRMTRHGAYKWLGSCMKKPIKDCHIGMFQVDECKKVVALVAWFHRKEKQKEAK